MIIISFFTYYEWILGFAVLAFIYSKWAPLDVEKKHKHIFIAAIALVAGLKFFMIGISNAEIQQFANIYPRLLGNDFLLGVIALVTSLFSVILILLWKRKYYYIESKIMHFIIFLCFEFYFYLFSVMVYFVSGLMKVNFML